jgi:hypothetical protein
MTLLALALLVQVLDGITFLLAYERFGITGELNPVARYMYDLGGIEAVMLPKIVGVTLVALGILWLEDKNEYLAKTGALALLFVGALGWTLNSLSLMVD